MKINMKYIFALIISIPILTHAEIIKGPAIVMGDDKRDSLYKLEDGVKVVADPREDNWYRISFEFRVSSSDVVKEEWYDNSIRRVTLKKGATLRNKAGKKIGITLQSMDVFAFSKKGSTVLCGDEAIQVHERYIYPDSDIDSQVAKIIKSGSLHFEDFKSHFRQHHYERWIDSSGFSSFIFLGAAVDFDPVIRILVVFKAGRLICIIHYSKVDFPRRTVLSTVREFRASYFTHDKEIIRKFEEIFFELIYRMA